MKTALSVLTIAGLSFASVAAADPGGGDFLERFALSADREAVLRELIPGTPDYFYWHALHYQNTGRREELEDLLRRWRERIPESSPQRETILTRQHLLDYAVTPERTLTWLRETLGLRFDRERDTLETPPDIPVALDPALVSRDAFLAQAIRQGDALEGVTDSGLRRLAAGETELDAQRRRHLLSRLRRPDVPGLTKLILADLATRESQGFGEFAIHRALLLPQLRELLAARTELSGSQAFVETWLKRLTPPEGDDPVSDPAVRGAWLDRLLDYTESLPPAFHSLRAHVLYHKLRFDRSRGKSDSALLLAYLKLPRPVAWVPREFRERRGLWDHPVDFGADFSALTGLPSVGNDEPLVRALLLDLLANDGDGSAFREFVERSWLDGVLAEAKLTSGAADPEKLVSMLPPAAWEALRTRTDLEFAPDSRESFAPEDDVTIDLFVKNVPRLLVKVFEIGTENVHRAGREANTDLDLDGLVAGEEHSFEYNEEPVRRVRRTFSFPSMQRKRGVWIVEFIGGGKSSRALIRKGSLHVLTVPGGAGTAVTVLDEKAQPVPGAWLQAGTQRFEAGDDGRILVPFSTTPGPQPVVVGDRSGFTSLRSVDLAGENYALTAGFFVHEQSLQPGAAAQVAIRPVLTSGGVPIDLAELHRASLTIVAHDREGIPSTTVTPLAELPADGAVVVPFTVPDRLASLTFTLAGEVTSLVTGKPVAVSAAEGIPVNGLSATDRVSDLHLRRTADGWRLEELGRTGEPRANRRIRVSLTNPDFTAPVTATLRTGDDGAVDLGALDGIASVTAESASGLSRTFALPLDGITLPPVLQVPAGEPVRIAWPWAADPTQDGALSVLETRGGEFVRAVTAGIALRDGVAEIAGLEPGSYSLLVRPTGQAATVRIAAGREVAGCIVSGSQELEVAAPQPPAVTGIERRDAVLPGADTAVPVIVIRLANVPPDTRVHVMTSRFLPGTDAIGSLGDDRLPPPWAGRPAWLPSLYQSARTIGDEYRYVLERRMRKQFPGNMLPRPGLLLNPRAVADTVTTTREAAPGEALAAMKAPAPADSAIEAEERLQTRRRPIVPPPMQADYSFLADSAVVACNLRPDENGEVLLDASRAGDRTMLRVLAVTGDAAVVRDFALPDAPMKRRDLRLARPLDPASHFAPANIVTALAKGESFRSDSEQPARYRVCGDLGEAWQILLNLSHDQELQKFAFLKDWDTFDDARKQTLYSEFACHELHFFLYRKDPAFFRSAVLPFLNSKMNATFVDNWLTGRDLAGYLRLREFERLNTFERILLARRIAERQDAVRRDIRDRLALAQPDPAAHANLFETVLLGSGLRSESDFDAGVALQRRNGRDKEGAGAFADGFAKADSAEAASDAPGLPRAAPARRFGRGAAQLAKREDRSRLLELGDAMFRQVDATREWAESNYHPVSASALEAALVPPDRFWLDYAMWDGASPFLSDHLPEAAGSFTEMALALAVLDLPFPDAAEPPEQTRTDDGGLTLTTSRPLLVFHREMQPARAADPATSLLVSQNFYRNGERYIEEDGVKRDRFVTGEFLTGVVYGCQIVMTNPGSASRRIDATFQIPEGAIPVMQTRPLQTVPMVLEPYHTSTLDFHFYFPAAGDYAHYPVHLTGDGALAAAAGPVAFRVVDTPGEADTESWEYVSQFAESDAVLEYLKSHNVHGLNLSRMAWRLKDADFYRRAIALLRDRLCYDPLVWSYGVLHNDPAAIRDRLDHEDALLDACGPYLESPLVTIDPVERRKWQLLEYQPLVNARAHPLGGRRPVLNDRFGAQYRSLLEILTCRPSLDTNDRMSVLYALALQDRVGESLEWFATIDPDKLPGRVQFDYFQAWLSFFTGDLAPARRIAESYATYPVKHWRAKFEAVAAQLASIDGGKPDEAVPDDREGTQEQLADAAPRFDFRIEAGRILVDSRNVRELTVNYYPMDLEFLFSANPFVSRDPARFRVVKPNRTEQLTVPDGRTESDYPLPREFRNANVLVEIAAAGQTKSLASYASQLDVWISENYGQLTVTHAGDHRPLPKTYVKVFAEQNGSPVFYKDGYTDLRGKFDYASLSTNTLDSTTRFAILVLSEESGATVREVRPPQR